MGKTKKDVSSSSESEKDRKIGNSRKSSNSSRQNTSIKMEPVSCDSETEVKQTSKPKPPSNEAKFDVKKQLSKDMKVEKDVIKVKVEKHEEEEKKPKKKHSNSSRSKDKKKEKNKDLKMSKIFGTSSEDESSVKTSKPPTPVTATTTKQPAKTSKPAKVKVEQEVFSDSNSDSEIRETLIKTEKMLDSPKTEKMLPNSPALMSDSDDNELSRPPTPTFQPKKPELVPAVVVTAENNIQKLENIGENENLHKNDKSRRHSGGHEERRNSREDLFIFSDDEAQLDNNKKRKKKERNRCASAHERQKGSESLFDSLLTVNIDPPARTGSKKSPSSLKSPSLKSPGLSKSPGGLKSPLEGQKSPISHRSPMISPGAKPTYLLAHTFDKSSREAEKIHRAQDLLIKDQDRSHKEKEKNNKQTENLYKEVKQVKKVSDLLIVKEVAKETAPDAKTELKEKKNETEVKEKKNETEPKDKNKKETEIKEKKNETEINEKKNEKHKLVQSTKEKVSQDVQSKSECATSLPIKESENEPTVSKTEVIKSRKENSTETDVH